MPVKPIPNIHIFPGPYVTFALLQSINWHHKRAAAASSNFYFTTVTPHSENTLATSLSTTAGDKL